MHTFSLTLLLIAGLAQAGTPTVRSFRQCGAGLASVEIEAGPSALESLSTLASPQRVPKAAGVLPASATRESAFFLWSGTPSEQCDQLAGITPSPLFIEEGVGISMVVGGQGSLTSADALEILTAVAPDAGARVTQVAGITVLEHHGAAAASSFVAVVVREGDPQFESLLALGEVREGGQQTVRLASGTLALIAVADGGLDLMKLVGLPAKDPDSSRVSERELRRSRGSESRERDRQQRLIEESGFTAVDGGTQFTRAAVAYLASKPMSGLAPERGDDGQVRGYRVIYVNRSLAKLGVKRDDVLVSLDGRPLHSEAVLLQLPTSLLEADEIKVQLERQRTPVALVWTCPDPPEALAGSVPAPSLNIDLEEARLRGGLRSTGPGELVVPRSALVEFLTPDWGGEFVSDGAGGALTWMPGHGDPRGLTVLFGEDPLTLVRIAGKPPTPGHLPDLFAAFATDATVVVEGHGHDGQVRSLQWTLEGPALADPQALLSGRELPVDTEANFGPLGQITLANRCALEAKPLDTWGRVLRMVLHKGPDGAIDGVRTSAIRSNSLFDRLDVKNGDTIHRVDDQPLTTEAELQSLGQALQTPGPHTFYMTRRGQSIEVSFTVADGACSD